jgi:hypothetical protein
MDGTVTRITKVRIIREMLIVVLECKKTRRRPNPKLEDNIKMVFQKVEWGDVDRNSLRSRPRGEML